MKFQLDQIFTGLISTDFMFFWKFFKSYSLIHRRKPIEKFVQKKKKKKDLVKLQFQNPPACFFKKVNREQLDINKMILLLGVKTKTFNTFLLITLAKPKLIPCPQSCNCHHSFVDDLCCFRHKSERLYLPPKKWNQLKLLKF